MSNKGDRYVIFMQWLAFIVIISIVFIHGFWPTAFVLDTFSMGLLFLLAIPLLSPFLKKAKWFGAEFNFKEDIKRATKLVEKSEAKAKEISSKQGKKEVEFKTFTTETARQLLGSDPNLALAALRIEIERVLTAAVAKIDASSKPKSLRDSINTLYQAQMLSEEQQEALQTICNSANKAVHGADVSKAEAEEIIGLAERLDNSFSFGYSVNFKPNKDYAKQGLTCAWEHCIELFPIQEERGELSCHVFGHDCPGGVKAKKVCKIK
ncbi:MAG TPA: DUF4145 domain-containing protein [Stenomitos sp.]